MSEAILSTLRRISRDLAAAGVPPLSPYWLAEAERFYLHPSARLLVEMVGRGGDKSRTSAMMAIAELLAGEHRVPPGERHYFVHVSENRDEASKTVAVLDAYLRVLGVPAAKTGDTIELGGMALGVKVLAARVGAVSGWRCVGWTADEAAKFDDDGADPTEEIIASIKAMTVTHPGARGRMFSSPVATLGTFYETWKLGDDEAQLAGHAPSWVANPSITEEATRRLERDPRKWSREYQAIPTEGSEEALFAADLVDRAQRAAAGDVPPERGVRYVAAMDPSLGRNAWTLVVAGVRVVGGKRKASIVLAREWRAPKGQHLDPAAVLTSIAAAVRPYGVRQVLTDQFHGEAHAAIATRMELGISVVVDKPAPSERLARYEATLTRFLDDAVELPRDVHVRADLLAVRRRVTSGASAFTISMAVTGDGRHADYAPSIVLALSRIVHAVGVSEQYARKVADVQEAIARHRGDPGQLAIDAERQRARRSAAQHAATSEEQQARARAEWPPKRDQRIRWPQQAAAVPPYLRGFEDQGRGSPKGGGW